jgi:hypothetical protein
MHRDFAEGLRMLAPVDLGYAEAWRLLRPVSARIGVPRPSYWRVRRFLIEERRRVRLRRERRDRILADLMAGLIKRPLFDATQTP